MFHSQVKIPSFETGFQILARHAHLVRPKQRLTVSQWARQHMTHYDPEALPYLEEIMDACSAPDTAEVGDMGPVQAGKSLVGEAFIGWSIEHDPGPFLLAQPDKTLAETFVKLRINQMIAAAPVLKRQLAPMANADNIFLKQFRSMFLVAAWPVENQFRQRTVQRGWLDDYDGFPTNADGQVDIEGKGSAIALLDGRMTIFKPRDTKLISSSPMLGADSGIEAFVATGTDERLRPVCPHCGDRIELDMIRDLKFDRGTPEQAEESAYVVCPANGCELLPETRQQLLASLKALPNKGFVATRPDAGPFRRTFRRDGLLTFMAWGALARLWREAEIAWETRQDEAPLKVFYNNRAGKNYRTQTSGEKPVETEMLKSRRETGWKIGTVPRGPKVLNLVVDVQHNRFEVGVIGYAKNRETWLVDRFPIDVLDDGLTQISPFMHKEHWRVLLPLFDRKWPLAINGADGKPAGWAPVLSLTIDTGGSDKKGDQATEGAKYFWELARAAGIYPNRITLVKGASKPNNVDLMPPARFADQKVKGGARRNSAKLWLPNVHKIKNMIDARLRRQTPGAGYIHLPEDLGEQYLSEMTAEELRDGKWEKLRPRNETWDILVYGEAAILKPPFAQSRSDMRWVPRDFRIVWPEIETHGQAAPTEPVRAEAAPPAVEAAAQPLPPAAPPVQREQPRPGVAGGEWIDASSRSGGSWL